MNENEQISALLGGGNASGGSNEDFKSKYEEAMRQLQSAKVEQGRVKSLDARNKELEKELAQLKGNQGAAKIAEQLTPEERGDIPEDYVGVSAKLAARAADNAVAGVNEKLESMRQEMARRAAQDFVGRIDRRFPGFLASIGSGGDKARPWASFLVHNSASVTDAFNRCDYDSLVYHIERFYRETLGVPPPDGESAGAAAPDPVSKSGGNAPAVAGISPNKTYTEQEYAALDEQCMKLRREGRFDEYRKLRDEIDTILAEDRIKG